MRRKVCHLTTVHPVFDTRIFFKEGVSLTKDYDVFLIAPHSKNETISSIHIRCLPKWESRFLRILLKGPILFLKALRINAALYHFHDPELMPYGLLLALMGKKVIYDIHEHVAEDLKQKKWLPAKGIFSNLHSYFENLTLKKCDIILANAFYAGIYENRMNRFAIVQNFAWPQLFHFKTNRDWESADRILLVGALSAARGLPVLIEALFLLKQEGISVTLQCVGNKSESVHYILQHSHFYPEVRQQLLFDGYKPVSSAYEDTEKCFAGAALLERLENNKYNYPTKLFEYMAVGLPVIVSDYNINVAVLDRHNCGVIANPDDAKSVAAAIRQLYLNKGQAKAMGKAGAIAAEKSYSWKSEEKKLLDFYGEVLR
ncbi:MAG: glycosyltransferase [Bacteroidota bacterium]|nr:glycosyltransferase [Bacteroidota bacterium]